MKLKLRLIAGGSVLSAVALAVMAVRGPHITYEGLFVAGLVVLTIGIFWK